MKITFDNSVQMSAEQTNTYRAHAESKYIAGNYGAGNRAAGNIMTSFQTQASVCRTAV